MNGIRNGKMKAVICTKYGSPKVLKLTEKEIPSLKENEVLIRNHGSSINTVDVVYRGGKGPKGTPWILKPLIGLFIRRSAGNLRKPRTRTPGFGFAGEIVSVGKDVGKNAFKFKLFTSSSNSWGCFTGVSGV